MMHQTQSALTYYWRAKTRFQVHSPILFALVDHMLDEKKRYYAMDRIESERYRLLQDNRMVQREDYGAGSRLDVEQTIENITKNSVSPRQQCEEMFRLIDHMKPKTILELGSCVGISTAYLATAHTAAQVYSLEGDSTLIDIAERVSEQLDIRNVQFIQGAFQNTLPTLLQQIHTIDCAFLDGHHTYEATIEYFQMIKPLLSDHAIVIIDDIYWSEEMTAAWNDIKKDGSINASVDLFYYGILIKNSKLTSQEHFTIIREKYKPWMKLSAL